MLTSVQPPGLALELVARCCRRLVQQVVGHTEPRRVGSVQSTVESIDVALALPQRSWGHAAVHSAVAYSSGVPSPQTSALSTWSDFDILDGPQEGIEYM